MIKIQNENILVHHGILGMKWGIRRFQNKDGSPTEAGRKRYGYGDKQDKGSDDEMTSNKKTSVSKSETVSKTEITKRKVDSYRSEMLKKYALSDKTKFAYYTNLSDEQLKVEIKRRETTKKFLIGAVTTAGIAGAAYLAVKYNAFSSGAKNAGEMKEAIAKAIQDTDYVIKQGDTIHRMSAFKDFDISKFDKKPLYGTITEGDRLSYMSFLKDWHGTGERYDVSLKATKDILVPSDKQARKIFDEVWSNNPEYRKQLKDTLFDTYSKFYPTYSKDAIGKEIDKLLTENPFKEGVYAIVKGRNDSQILFDAYRQKGYGAIIDYFDRGSLGETPVVFINANKDLIKTGEQYVTSQMEKDAIRKLAGDEFLKHPMHSYATWQKEVGLV